MLKAEYSVTKHNVLTEMRTNSMSLQELRFLSIYISKINPFDVNSRYVEFKLDEFQKIMGLGRINQKHIEDVFDRLLGKIVKIPIESKKSDKVIGYSKFTLFNKCQCFWDEDKAETLIIIDAHEDILPYLFDMQNNFFKYQLWNCLKLKSTNQIRMYELLKRWENARTQTFYIDDLKIMLGIKETEYPVYSIFRRDVIEVCKKALKENTDIYFEYEPIKKMRKVVKIKFLIFKNKDYKDPLQLDDFIQTNKDVVEVDFNNDVTSSVMGDCEPEPTSEPNVITEKKFENEFPEQQFSCDDDYIPEPPPTDEEKEKTRYNHNQDFWCEETSTSSVMGEDELKEHKFKDSFLDEFNQKEINAFYHLIKHKEMTKEQKDDFIQIQYTQMLVANHNNKIRNAYKYLDKMIKVEIEEYTPPPTSNRSYNLEEADELLNTIPSWANGDGTVGEFNNTPIVKLWSENAQNTLRDFIKYREEKKNSFVGNGLMLFVEKLIKYDDDTKIEMMNNAMRGGYPDVVPLKKESNGYPSNEKKGWAIKSTYTQYNDKLPPKETDIWF